MTLNKLLEIHGSMSSAFNARHVPNNQKHLNHF